MLHPDPKPADSLAAACVGTRFRLIFEAKSVTSTNAVVAAWARAGQPEGAVLVADEQTAGRGRRDRSWASPAGSSVAMSVLLRPAAVAPDSWGWISLLAGMAVTRGLREVTGAGERVGLKWPNDVLVDGLKVCGILSERVDAAEGPAVVVGMGINLRLERDELPIPQATSLALAELRHDRDEIVAAVLRNLETVYADWLAEGPPVREYAAACASVGSQLTITPSDSEQVSGRGVGVDRHGRLLVEVGPEVLAFAVGDVVHARLR